MPDLKAGYLKKNLSLFHSGAQEHLKPEFSTWIFGYPGSMNLGHKNKLWLQISKDNFFKKISIKYKVLRLQFFLILSQRERGGGFISS